MRVHLCVNQVQAYNTIKTTYRNSTGGEKSISMSRAIQPIVVVRFIYEKKKKWRKNIIPNAGNMSIFFLILLLYVLTLLHAFNFSFKSR